MIDFRRFNNIIECSDCPWYFYWSFPSIFFVSFIKNRTLTVLKYYWNGKKGLTIMLWVLSKLMVYYFVSFIKSNLPTGLHLQKVTGYFLQANYLKLERLHPGWWFEIYFCNTSKRPLTWYNLTSLKYEDGFFLIYISRCYFRHKMSIAYYAYIPDFMITVLTTLIASGFGRF